MATPPDFSSGAVLTAAQMNAVGLWKVASGALSAGTGVTNFQGCFTSDYRDYRIVIDSMGTSANSDFYLRFLQGASNAVGSTANNYWAFQGLTSGGGASPASANASVGIYLGCTFTGANVASGQSIIDVTTPQEAKKTFLTIQTVCVIPGVYNSRNGAAAFDTTAVFDGFQISSLGAPILSGNVTVYGYRK